VSRPAPAWGVFLFFACLYALSLGRGFYSSDGEVMFHTAAALASRGALELPPDPALPQIVAGRSGRFYSKYEPGLPLLAVPLYAAGDRLAAINAAHRTQVAATAVLLLPVLAGAGTITALYRLARRWAGGGRAVTVALAAGLATPLWPYSRMLFAEAVLACALAASVALVLSGPPRTRRLAGAGAIFGLGVLARASLAIYALPLAWLLARTGPVRDARSVGARWAAFALGALPLAAGVLAHNVLRFGALWRFGYAGEGFTTPPLDGVAGLLLSPGKSVLLYAPPLILGGWLGPRFARRQPGMAGFLALAWIAALGFYGVWWAWHGGWCWGPRLLVPLVPLSCLPLSALPDGRRWRAAAVGLIVLGAAINALGVLTDPVAAYAQASDAGATDYDRLHWTPGATPLAVAVERALAGQTEPLALFHLTGSGLPRAWTVGVPLAALAGMALGGWVVARPRRNGRAP